MELWHIHEDAIDEIESDYSRTGFEWADGGRFCYLIRQQDLTLLRFDRVCTVFESGETMRASCAPMNAHLAGACVEQRMQR